MLERPRQLAVGAASGVSALVVGYLVTYLSVGDAVESSVLRQLADAFGGDLSTSTVVGWVFFNAQAVPTRLPGLLGSTSVDLLARADAFPAFLYVVPPLLLLVAGATVGVRAADRSGLVAGVGGVVAGYLLSVGVAAVLFSVELGGTTAGPPLLTAVAVAGVCYPAVFGGVGGAVGRWASR
jgi:hypothetical protein